MVIIITALIWWKGFYSPSAPGKEFSSSFQGKEISIDFRVLESEIFEDMQAFLKVSMPKEVGKENPFFQLSSPSEQPPAEEETE